MIDQAALTLANPSRSGGTLLCAFPHPFRMGINQASGSGSGAANFAAAG